MAVSDPPADARHDDASYFWHGMGSPAEGRAKPAKEIASGDGIYVTDGAGRRLLDATSGGLANVTLGYSADAIKRAIAAQLETLPYFSSFRGTTNRPAEELSRRLIEDWFAPDGMRRVFLSSGGSDAVETALRLARQYWKIQGARDRYKFIALRNGYHGSHFGGASLNSKANIRRQYEPLLQGCFHIPTPCIYRNPFDERDPIRLGALCARMLEEEIVFQGPDTVAAFIAEPVTGAGGLVVPPPNFWPSVRAVCDKYGVLLIADEVLSGFGRTGRWFAVDHDGVTPDLMTMAKALTGGYAPGGAVIVSDRVAHHFDDAVLSCGLTSYAHPLVCAAIVAAIETYRDDGLVERAATLGQRLRSRLTALALAHPHIADVRGLGLL
ncbi:MAG TPA: aminotransferase class III-fold pyridoxal phosphate-dependent enzyme, partial [Acetobacteraceae bacterium]|nr:aminotransferase class III-fold pyridoxal phosphate-dependent enzyme [Acetobacteraceae bacterium]